MTISIASWSYFAVCLPRSGTRGVFTSKCEKFINLMHSIESDISSCSMPAREMHGAMDFSRWIRPVALGWGFCANFGPLRAIYEMRAFPVVSGAGGNTMALCAGLFEMRILPRQGCAGFSALAWMPPNGTSRLVDAFLPAMVQSESGSGIAMGRYS
jgi:hypothetical protein